MPPWLLNALIMPLIFSILKAVFPVKGQERFSPSEIEALGETYSGWYWGSLVIVAWYVALGGYVCYEVLSYFSQLKAKSLEPHLFLLMPGKSYRALTVILVGLLGSGLMTHVSLKILLADRFAEYQLWRNLKNGFDETKASLLVAIPGLILTALLILAGQRSYLMFREAEVVYQRPEWKEPRVYSYSQVQGIAQFAKYRSPIGIIASNPYAAIRFEDGTTWTTGNFFSESSKAENVAIFKLVASKSGKTLDRYDLIQNWKP